jgi:AraC-like DNA-binding protein
MAFQAFLRQMGAPVERHLRRAGLPALCEEPDAFVPVLRVWRFFDNESRKETRSLGWHVGQYVGDHSLNANLLRKIEKAPTLLSAIQTLIRSLRSEGTDIDIGIIERPEDILFYTHYWGLRDKPGYHISQAYQLGVLLDLIRPFIGCDWTPGEIGLETARLPPGMSERFPGTQILLRRQMGYIAIPRKLLHRAAHQHVSKTDEALDSKAEKPWQYIDRLRAVARAYLSEGYISEKTAARLMDTSVRTMTRTLAAQGITYGKLIDDLRFEVAKERLSDADIRIIDVAQSIGFRDQANFTRMFRRMAGITPGQFRKIVQGEEPEFGLH